ncbi:MAG TPA: CoA-binding protein [Actinomycetota bacterium]|nr:CoA-binding protein [Actinomycetota bacterium]
MYDDFETARKILTSYRRFAIVGCSANPSRASFRVATYLLGQGFEVIPVNPNEERIGDLDCFPELSSIPTEELEVVDIFRRSEFAGKHVDEAIELGAKAIWMQLGVIDAAAARRARDAGLDVVMDRCPAIDHPLIRSNSRPTNS